MNDSQHLPSPGLESGPSSAPASTLGPTPPQRNLMRRVVMIEGITVLFLALGAAIWFAADALLLIFACILFSVLLYELSVIVRDRLKINRQLALVVVLLLLVAVIGLGGWAMAPQIAEQSSALAKQLPASIERVQDMVKAHPMLQHVAQQMPSTKEIVGSLQRFAPDAGLLFGGVLGTLANIVIIIAVGIYFASSPRVYTHGFIKLIPQPRRARAGEVLDTIGTSLARWLLGKGASMLIVAAILSTGLTMLGVPLGLILGIIAGLMDFIPYVGPILGGVPAVLIALSTSTDLALYTGLLLLAIQMLDGYVLLPVIESRSVNLPPALTIIMQLIFGTLFGFAGVALATPLTAVLVKLVNMLYVEDILGDRSDDSEPHDKDTSGHAQPRPS
ncbi:AI-2E family transporter [Massilia sp. 9096]|uniref:AI-2E family transporter n=1 Tax=Massilia sp. 9096 TaxID=1500894 RepID=UPI00068BF533|nr:AI-2E family transporter [Massilia sp. 9096]